MKGFKTVYLKQMQDKLTEENNPIIDNGVNLDFEYGYNDPWPNEPTNAADVREYYLRIASVTNQGWIGIPTSHIKSLLNGSGDDA